MAEKLPTLLDNRDDNTVLQAFRRLLPHSRRWDVATGYFEIGSLLDLDGLWQPLEEMRILLGDEVTRRTRAELLNSLRQQSDESIEKAKERDDSLTGLAAIRDSLASKHIKARVYTRAKFHAKGYIMDSNDTSPVDFAVVGSSNFTHPGLTQNLELNILTTEQHQINALREWYQQVWKEGEDVSEEVLKVVERHLREYLPFEVYAKALYEYFAGREKTQTDWEKHESVLYRMLSKYQRDGYHRALQIADSWGGALICDGVGLGKTFIGLMLLEHALYHKKKALLIVPKSARKSVWERNLNLYLRPKYRRAYRDQIQIHNHTDFGRDGTITEEDVEYYRDYFDVVLVDEAHHFRHSHRNRARRLMHLCEGKQVYLLTATPINNSLVDLYNLTNFFAQDDSRHFARIGIQNLRRHFTEAEKRIGQETDAAAAIGDVQAQAQSTDFLRTDVLLKEVLIQRSRRFVMDSEALEENRPCFPRRMPPVVVNYSLNKVYAGLYEDIKLAFDREFPLLSLAVYNTEAFKRRDQDKATLDYQSNVVGLIRTLLLKRLESSYKAFEASLEDLLHKMALFVQANAPEMWQAWQRQHKTLWTTTLLHQEQRRQEREEGSEDEEENDAPELPRSLDPEQYDVASLLTQMLGDMTHLVTILTKVYQKLSPVTDDKLTQLTAPLRSRDLARRKLVIFTEFRDTARYLYRALKERLPEASIEELDSSRKIDREKVIKRFAPYYNCNPPELSSYLADQIDILVSTDVLSEGLNLQDANILVNYDVHWNPVRLMQRIGRVDRRLDRSKPVRHETVHIYNFLPPQELEHLLNLLKRVSGKILRINTTLGIEAPVLTPDDPEAAIKLFNERYEQQENETEALELELQRLEKEHPALYESLPDLPRRLFSGKRAGDGSSRGLFCAYRYPAPSEEATGELRWYFRDATTGAITEGVEAIAALIRCEHDTLRVTEAGTGELTKARREIEVLKVNRHLRDMQAVAGAKAALVCWMEVC